MVMPVFSNLRRAFDLMDADGDGRISFDDLRRFMDGDDATIKSMMSVADSNRDGYVEYEEFEKVLNLEAVQNNKVMEEAFRMMDRDGDGMVGHQDLKSYLNYAGVEADDEDVKAMISLASDQEGVTLQSLLNILSL